MVTLTLSMFGRIIFWVNNASITSQLPMSELNEMTEKVWDSLFAINVKGMFHCAKAVFPYMKKTPRRRNRQPRECSGIERYRFFNPLCNHEIDHPYDDTLTCHLTRT